MQVYFNGARMRSERRSRKWSQMEVAEMVNTTERYVRELEKGRKHNPSAAIVYRISRALGIPMDELMMGIPDEEEDVRAPKSGENTLL